MLHNNQDTDGLKKNSKRPQNQCTKQIHFLETCVNRKSLIRAPPTCHQCLSVETGPGATSAYLWKPVLVPPVLICGNLSSTVLCHVLQVFCSENVMRKHCVPKSKAKSKLRKVASEARDNKDLSIRDLVCEDESNL